MRLSRKEDLVYDKIRSDMLSKNQSRLESLGDQIYIGEYNTGTFSGRFKHSLLNFAKKLPYENGIIYNRGKIMTIRGDEDSVGFSRVDDDFMEKSLVMHNHTEKNKSMSDSDLLLHVGSNLGESAVVDKNGNKYYLRTDSTLTRSEAKDLYIEAADFYYSAKEKMHTVCNVQHYIMQYIAQLDSRIKYFSMLAGRS